VGLRRKRNQAVEFVERRALERTPATLKASVWSPRDLTRRVMGETIDLSTNGCLLHLPGLSPQASLIDIQLELLGKTVSARARVVWREAPDLVGVEFESFAADGQADVVEFRRMLIAQAADAVAATRRRWFRRR
jgi:hypothetical protein